LHGPHDTGMMVSAPIARGHAQSGPVPWWSRSRPFSIWNPVMRREPSPSEQFASMLEALKTDHGMTPTAIAKEAGIRLPAIAVGESPDGGAG